MHESSVFPGQSTPAADPEAAAASSENSVVATPAEVRDAARYRWLRKNLGWFCEDEAGAAGVAFSCQIPLTEIERLSEPELIDAIADAYITGPAE